ncbi:MAG: hypothetical protein ACFE0J_12920 [Elainellaceae cyanobacterium]
MSNALPPTKRPFLQPGDVTYAPGWEFCYEVMSGPFCRINYIHWQGNIAAAPADAHSYISYFIRALGGRTVHRFIVKITNFQLTFR